MIDNKVLNELRNLTSFENFEKETSQLQVRDAHLSIFHGSLYLVTSFQKVDLNILRSDGTVPGKSHGRIVFFINVYNMLRSKLFLSFCIVF